MKAYYHLHESAYQRIKSQGYFGWGNAKNLAELGDAKTSQYLNQIIDKYFSSTVNLCALDLGCGTGTTAFELAKRGFRTTGIDISETAIAMGADLARQQQLEIQFIAGDVLDLGAFHQKFDFIYDSHLLHCIVFDEDRKKVFAGVKTVLNSGGLFIIDTMVMPDTKIDPSTMFSPNLRFDHEFILWNETKLSIDKGIVEIDGQFWCPQRRVYPAEKVLTEIVDAGFAVIEKQIDKDEELNKPSLLRLVLSSIA